MLSAQKHSRCQHHSCQLYTVPSYPLVQDDRVLGEVGTSESLLDAGNNLGTTLGVNGGLGLGGVVLAPGDGGELGSNATEGLEGSVVDGTADNDGLDAGGVVLGADGVLGGNTGALEDGGELLSGLLGAGDEVDD